MDPKPKNQPRYRFPEFQKAGEWKYKTLSDIADISSGTTPLRSNLEFYTSGTIPWVKTTDLNNSFITKTEEKITLKAKARVNPTGSILIAMYGGFNQIGRTGLLVFPSATNQAISVLVVDQRIIYPVYVLAWLNAKVENWKRIASSSRKDPNITGGDVANFPISVPEVSEQQKIAECLSSVDELTVAQARKVDALKTHKKGLMQQLFPREGETQPRLRFPEFQNAGEWEEYSLGQLIEIASGQVDPKQPPYCDSPQIGSENIESHSGKLVNVKSAGDKGVISGNYAFDENDILYSKIRPALNKVAAPAFKGICSADIYPIRPADGSLLRSYLFYLLLSQDFLDYAIRNSERGKIPKINRDALLTYKALIPSPAEQQRIASCLSSLDALITAETQKHEVLKTHKKGLMQQVFPSSEEVAV